MGKREVGHLYSPVNVLQLLDDIALLLQSPEVVEMAPLYIKSLEESYDLSFLI